MAIATPTRAAARAAGLRYVSPDDRGIKRVKIGKKQFAYVGASGKRIHNPEILDRIKRLVIPPAWTDVWICLHANAHIQAVGRDQRGRKQYRYHDRWRQARDRFKYDKLLDFARVLPRIRRQVKKQLALPGLPREKVLAAVIATLERTFIRVGNEEYADQNKSFGLTTLRDKHAQINGKKVRFEFRGKSGVEHQIDLEDSKLAEVIRKCRDLPGEELFQYVDDHGNVCDVGSNDVNAYLRKISRGDFTTKDFRTWAGTVLAAQALREFDAFESSAQAKRNIVRAVEVVSQRLGNTKAVCRKCYIHPGIIGSYLAGKLESARSSASLTHFPPGISKQEALAFALLSKGQRTRHE